VRLPLDSERYWFLSGADQDVAMLELRFEIGNRESGNEDVCGAVYV
jgi:hypothetical protein